jgi:hypothetical protein
MLCSFRYRWTHPLISLARTLPLMKMMNAANQCVTLATRPPRNRVRFHHILRAKHATLSRRVRDRHGLVFGVDHARQASRLTPIDAPRYE